jgi:hypothetical protein
MFGGMRAARSSACTSDLRFDAWLAGELEAAAQAELSAHVAGCARCRERQQRITAERAAFAASPRAATPGWLQSERAAAPGRRQAVVGGSVAVALAAAVVLALIPLHEPDGVRVKGGDQLSYFVKRGDAVQRGARKQRVRPGDKLRFAYTALAPRYLAIVSLDAAEQVSVYYPTGERAARVEPGVEVPLPSAVELDGVLGEERVFALFCTSEIALAPLRAELLAAAHTLKSPAGCTLDELRLTKEAMAP